MTTSTQRGFFVTVDGPGRVGKSTDTALVKAPLADLRVSVHATPSPTAPNSAKHIRHGTHTYRG